MLKVGLTGGIGSGKTTVCRLFETLGVAVYYADDWAKWLMKHDIALITAIKAAFGESIYDDAGELQRKVLADIIFQDPTARQQLESMVHPAVFQHTAKWIEQQTHSPYIIKEAALLFESGSYRSVDKIITVTAPIALRLARATSRDQSNVEQIKQRMAAQLPDTLKIEQADFVIHNDGQQLLIPQVCHIHQQLLDIAKSIHQ